MPTATVNADDNNIRLDRWFKRHHRNVPFTLVAKLIRKGQIKLNAKKADITTKVNAQDIISFPEFEQQQETRKKVHYNNYIVKDLIQSIIYRDDEIIVLNKPAGLAVQGGSKINCSVDDLSEFLKFDYTEKPKLVHRLDKETSGILILARKTSVAAELGGLFQRKAIKKTYYALIKGMPKPSSGKIDEPLEKQWHKDFEKVTAKPTGKKALTYYKVIDHIAQEFSLLELEIVTGRTHQIRAHLSMIGHPVLGDEKYGMKQDEVPNQFQQNLYLHAYQVEFKHKGVMKVFNAPLPKYFDDALKTYGLSVKKKL